MRKAPLLVLAVLVVASSLLCKVLLPGGSEPTPEIDMAATIQALQATQAAIQQQTSIPTGAPETVQPAPTEAAEVAPAQPTPPLDGETEAPPLVFEPGSISGSLSYPGEMIPPLRIVATNTSTGEFHSVESGVDQSTYIIDNLSPGIYTLVAYSLDPGSLPAAGYTQAVLCGLESSCTDHSLVEVAVLPDQDLTGIDIQDWYAPEGSFPPDPTR